MNAPRAVLDACVLYPTVLREILIGCARAGLFVPIWSSRLLEEWARAAERRGGAADAALARGEAARLGAVFPEAGVDGPDNPALWLPDPADVHVLSTAIAAGAGIIVTLNLRDFPARELDVHGVRAEHPDTLLRGFWADAPEIVENVVGQVHDEAKRLSGTALPLRALLKRARLPRLGKALAP